MGVKRSADELGPSRTRPRREDLKRMRLSPTAQDTNNSSDPSSCSVSEDSALQSSPRASEHTRQSSMSSLQPSSYENESESSVSTSSDESSVSDSDEEEEVVTIGGPKKPTMSDLELAGGAQDLKARIASFLPQLAEANDLLVNGQEVYSMEDVDENEQHIEMNLGLGVLEEKNGDSTSDSSDDNEEQSEDEDEQKVPASSGTIKRVNESQEADVMGKLLGSRTGRRRVDIEDLG